jgi:hypothetical protein
MITHVKVLAWLHIILGALGVFAALVVLLIFGGIAGIVGSSADLPDARIAVPILSGIGGLLFIVVLLLSIPSIIAGIGLLRLAPWARILAIVISAFDLLNVPFGTALGIYGLWALTKRETEALFAQPRYQNAGY